MVLTDHTSHRPWPLPARPWVMHQAWNDFLFMHWPVPAEVMRELVPEPLELDLHEGVCYVGVIPFHMTDVRPRGTMNVPGLSAFPELNVRTYVTYDGHPGVYFLSLDASNRLAVETARATYRLPYFKADMHWTRDGETIEYRSTRTDGRGSAACWEGSYTTRGPYTFAVEGTREHWLSERYALYTVDQRTVWRTDVHHLPWPLRSVDVALRENTMGAALGLELAEADAFAMVSPGVDVLVWAPTRVS